MFVSILAQSGDWARPRIGAQLNCQGGKFRNPGGRALNVQNIETGTDMFFRGGFAARGAVWLVGAKIGGQFSCSGGKLPQSRRQSPQRRKCRNQSEHASPQRV